MSRLKAWALSGVVMSLAATGYACAQAPEAPRPPAPPAAAESRALPDDAVDAVVAQAAGDDRDDLLDDDDGGDDGDEVRPAPAPAAAADAPADAGDGSDRPGERAGRRDDDRRGEGRRGHMGRMDLNGDGTIAREEFQGRRIERLRAADTNRDGTLSEAELEDLVLQRMAERRAKRMMNRLDIDGNGTVTLEEISGMRDKRFGVMDLNDDGTLDRREIRELHRNLDRPGMERGEGRGEGRGMEHGRHGRGHGGPDGEGGRHHRGPGDRMMEHGERW